MKDWVKGTFKSITIAFNSIIGAVLVAVPLIQEAMPQLQDLLTVTDYKRLMTALIVGNILLRFKTSKPLSEK